MKAGVAVLLIGLALVLAACGGSGRHKQMKTTRAASAQHRGGTLKVLSNTDFDNIDPGIAYNQRSFEWLNVVDRSLMSFKPGDASHEVPDLASAPPSISPDGRTVTVHIKPDVRFSPPVNRAVTSADVKYAIERGFTKQVATGYVGAYFGALLGAPSQPGAYRPIPGIETPNKTTIVFKLTKPLGGQLALALVLPVTAPVPKEYARRYDAKTPSQYGQHQVATGPYMLQSYRPGRRLVLVRNPNWSAASDYRPAYVDRIEWTVGNDPTVAGNQILAGRDMVSGDFMPPPIVEKAAKRYASQLRSTSIGSHYIALNTKLPPFDNVNLRKAVSAATDKTELQRIWGGPMVGDIATHFIPPIAGGFAQAGGLKGPRYDFDTDGAPNPAAVAKYMRFAGFPSGKYHGPRILMLGSKADPGAKMSQAFLEVLQKLGFDVNFKSVEDSTLYTQFCDRPASNYNVCATVGWLQDFPDPSTILDPTFNGEHIVPSGNSNWSLLNDPKIDATLDKANTLIPPAARDAAYAKIDDRITGTAAAIPWLWDRLANIESRNVKGVVAKWDACWDLAYTSVD